MGDPKGKKSEQLIEHLAQRIAAWRLELPAVLFLEVVKPFSFIASQGLLLCEPLLSFFYEEPPVAGLADLLADRANVQGLITCLEGKRTGPSHPSRGEGEG